MQGQVYHIKNVVHLVPGGYGTYEAFIDGVQVGPNNMGFRSHGGFYGTDLVRHDVTKAADIAAINVSSYNAGAIKVALHHTTVKSTHHRGKNQGRVIACATFSYSPPSMDKVPDPKL